MVINIPTCLNHEFMEGVMSRARYLKSLEQTIEAMKKATDDLTRENYELRQMLQYATQQPKQAIDKSYTRTVGMG